MRSRNSESVRFFSAVFQQKGRNEQEKTVETVIDENMSWLLLETVTLIYLLSSHTFVCARSFLPSAPFSPTISHSISFSVCHHHHQRAAEEEERENFSTKPVSPTLTGVRLKRTAEGIIK